MQHHKAAMFSRWGNIFKKTLRSPENFMSIELKTFQCFSLQPCLQLLAFAGPSPADNRSVIMIDYDWLCVIGVLIAWLVDWLAAWLFSLELAQKSRPIVISGTMKRIEKIWKAKCIEMLWNVAVFGGAWQTAHDIGLGENGTDMNWVPETGYINVHYTLEQVSR